jgi:2-polyprenyl-3-methyl-5-hydroxy-6-metoxy-1,4-benzoquinol methylase
MSVLARYRAERLRTRLFLHARWAWTPYREVARALPSGGRILDAGCGHGLLALVLALEGPARRVLATDHDASRIETARRAAQGLGNLEFRVADYRKVPSGPFDGMVYMDDLHYLTYAEQEALLRRSRKALKRGGVFVFRELGETGSLFSRWNRVHERLMTALGLTKAERLHFRSPAGWRSLAEKAGFAVVRVRPLARPPFADILYECVGR